MLKRINDKHSFIKNDFLWDRVFLKPKYQFHHFQRKELKYREVFQKVLIKALRIFKHKYYLNY